MQAGYGESQNSVTYSDVQFNATEKVKGFKKNTEIPSTKNQISNKSQ